MEDDVDSLPPYIHYIFPPEWLPTRIEKLQPVAAANVNFLVSDVQNDRLFLVVTIWIVCSHQ